VDAASGTQQWGFGIEGEVNSSPTVADGIVYVGSRDNSLYAVEAEGTGSSAGSRAQLRTLGHIGAAENGSSGQTPAPTASPTSTGTDRQSGESTPATSAASGEPSESTPATEEATAEDGPGFGLLAAAGALGGGGYLLRQRASDDD
jgi:outer membrane protein assembly factor BamB